MHAPGVNENKTSSENFLNGSYSGTKRKYGSSNDEKNLFCGIFEN